MQKFYVSLLVLCYLEAKARLYSSTAWSFSSLLFREKEMIEIFVEGTAFSSLLFRGRDGQFWARFWINNWVLLVLCYLEMAEMQPLKAKSFSSLLFRVRPTDIANEVVAAFSSLLFRELCWLKKRTKKAFSSLLFRACKNWPFARLNSSLLVLCYLERHSQLVILLFAYFSFSFGSIFEDFRI